VTIWVTLASCPYVSLKIVTLCSASRGGVLTLCGQRTLGHIPHHEYIARPDAVSPPLAYAILRVCRDMICTFDAEQWLFELVDLEERLHGDGLEACSKPRFK
jgi:hypothetical protein